MSLLTLHKDFSKCQISGHSFCNCRNKFPSNSVLMKTLYNIASAMAEVMVICGIHPCKAKSTLDVIVNSFIHFDQVKDSASGKPHKRMAESAFIHEMGCTCLMNRCEAKLAYMITKRAFKAFYNGTGTKDLFQLNMEKELKKTCECVWVHAAKRTSATFAEYQSSFFSAAKNYEQQIYRVYKHLYESLKECVGSGNEKVVRLEGGAEQVEKRKHPGHCAKIKQNKSTSEVTKLLRNMHQKTLTPRPFSCTSTTADNAPNALTRFFGDLHAKALAPRTNLTELMSDLTVNICKTSSDNDNFYAKVVKKMEKQTDKNIKTTKKNDNYLKLLPKSKKHIDYAREETEIPKLTRKRSQIRIIKANTVISETDIKEIFESCANCNAKQLICENEVKKLKKPNLEFEKTSRRLDLLREELKSQIDLRNAQANEKKLCSSSSTTHNSAVNICKNRNRQRNSGNSGNSGNSRNNRNRRNSPSSSDSCKSEKIGKSQINQNNIYVKLRKLRKNGIIDNNLREDDGTCISTDYEAASEFLDIKEKPVCEEKETAKDTAKLKEGKDKILNEKLAEDVFGNVNYAIEQLSASLIPRIYDQEKEYVELAVKLDTMQQKLGPNQQTKVAPRSLFDEFDFALNEKNIPEHLRNGSSDDRMIFHD